MKTSKSQPLSSVKILQPSKKKSLLSESDAFIELKTHEKKPDTFLLDFINKHGEAMAVTIDALILGVGAATVGAPFQFLSAKLQRSFFGEPKVFFNIFNGPPSAQARQMAVIGGVTTSVYWIVKSIRRGKEDYKTGLVAGFSGGSIGASVCGMSGSTAIAAGLLLGLAMCEGTKIKEKYLQQQAEEVLYKKTREMLSCLDLQRYENNFKRGSITDKSLMYLSDSDLKEVDIPVGARRMILGHIQREKEMEIGGIRNEV